MDKRLLLICDDDASIRESLRIILETEYALTFATNGEEALELLKTNNPALVLLDVKMPKLNGLETLKALKTLKPNLPVLMISGYESSDVALQAVRFGAEDYLPKPFDQEKVRAQVHSILMRYT